MMFSSLAFATHRHMERKHSKQRSIVNKGFVLGLASCVKKVATSRRMNFITASEDRKGWADRTAFGVLLKKKDQNTHAPHVSIYCNNNNAPHTFIPIDIDKRTYITATHLDVASASIGPIITHSGT